MKKKNRKPHILVASSYDASYVLRDIESIQKNFPTRTIIGHSTNKKFIKMLKLIFRILKGIIWADVSFIWFADFRALLTIGISKLLKRKTILVVGGYEVVHIPEISYGGSIEKILKRKINWIIHHADVVLSVSKASRDELIQHYSYTTSKLLYNGVETDAFKRDPDNQKEKIAITVGGVTLSNLARKGIETFVRAAQFLPGIPFFVIGKYNDDTYSYLQKIASENVVLTGFATEDQLVQYYQRAKVYVQVSAHEAFGVSLAEAMLCECVPVATMKGALPEVVGNTGFYVPYNNPKETAQAIKKAIGSGKGSEARNRILENFSMKRREEALKRIIQETA